VVFDKGSHTFRNDLYDLYKANRDEMPEDLRPQIPLTRDATRAFNLACLELEGFEADDIIATLARQAREAGGRVTIISSDKDLMQLVGGGVEMFDAMKNTRIDSEGVEAKFGVGPEKVIDVQALAGDSVDNIPGAPGIGVKTAALLINEYGDLDTLLERAEEIKQPKRRQTLIENAEQIRLSRRLVTLDDDVPMSESLDDLEVREPEAEQAHGIPGRNGVPHAHRRVAEALGVEAPVIADTDPGGAAAESVTEAAPEFPPIDHDAYDVVRDLDALQGWIEAARARGVVAVDTETTSLDEMTAELVGLSLSVEPGRACYIPVGHVTGGGEDLFAEGATRAEGQMALEEVLAALKPLLEDDAVLKVLQNAKYDVKVLARYGIEVAPIDDTMLMSYAMNAGLHGHGMDALAERYLGHSRSRSRS
jgi:DNA polymerase-1